MSLTYQNPPKEDNLLGREWGREEGRSKERGGRIGVEKKGRGRKFLCAP